MVSTRLLVDPSLPEPVDTAVTHAPGCPWHKAAVSHSGVSASTDGGISARVVGFGRLRRSLMTCAPIRPNWPATLIFWVSDSGMRFFFRDDATTRLLIPPISKLCGQILRIKRQSPPERSFPHARLCSPPTWRPAQCGFVSGGEWSCQALCAAAAGEAGSATMERRSR